MRTGAALALGVAALTVGACADRHDDAQTANITLALEQPGQTPARYRSPVIAKGVASLAAGDYREASAAFNEALAHDPQNPYLHFLNGFTYHLLAHQGDEGLRDLAEVGYDQALQFDPNLWGAAYGLGVLKLEARDYRAAQNAFARALLIDRDNAGALHGLAVASYYLGDLRTAQTAITHALKERPGEAAYIRSAALIAAANGDRARAANYADDYAAAAPEASQADFVRHRLADWAAFYDENPAPPGGSLSALPASPTSVQLAASSPPKPAPPPAGPPGNAAPETARPDLPVGTAGPQVLVDVTYIRTEDQVSSGMGVNLLNGLQLQYGYSKINTNTSLSGVPRFEAETAGTGIVSTLPFAQTIMRTLSIPSVTYSLNIFNSQESHGEVVARPTLIAQQGQPSSFFSGNELTVALAGQYGGNFDKLEVGLTLNVTPTLVTDKDVTLRVGINRMGFDPSIAGTFAQAVQTSKTYVNATATLGYDQTLILSGLTDRETTRATDRTPGVSEVPLLQYLFKRTDNSDTHNLVLVMLTPRRPASGLSDASRTAANPALPGGPGAAGPQSNLGELERQWGEGRPFSPPPNLAATFYHLRENGLYRQLRRGDLTLEDWTVPTSFSEAIRSDLQFLYY